MNASIKKAQEFATKAHSTQMYGQYPYVKHLQDVYDVLIEFGYTQEFLLVAAWLHDVLEDTLVSYSDIEEQFGEVVAEIVCCMTDGEGRNRKEKKEKAYAKIRSNPYAIVVKLCDRIANVRHGLAENDNGNKLSKMYKNEYVMFRWALHVTGHVDNLWNELDSLMGFEGYF